MSATFMPVTEDRQPAKWLEMFAERGYLLFSNCLQGTEIHRYRSWLEQAIEAEAHWRGQRQGHDAYQCVFLPYHHQGFFELLRHELLSQIINLLLGAQCTLYSFSNSSMPSGAGNFSSRIHVDRHYFTGSWLEGVGVLLALDDFCEANGASWWLAGSHTHAEAPMAEHFYASAQRLCVPAGSLLIFHPRLWHAGGINQTTTPRHAVTMAFCKPHIKPRLNFLALMQGRLPEDPQVLQRLGMYAQPPESLEQFYSAKPTHSQDLRNC